MGELFCDMDLLSTPDVHECSATDLVAAFVGQTGQKTVKLLEKALGKVLFIDEAYCLGQGAFGAEAVNALVDSLTKPRFLKKIVVILAGYEDSMNDLLRVNQGLSSRFSEEVVFTNMEPEDCWKFLRRNLEKTGITVDQIHTESSLAEIISLFRVLSALPSWGNGRDVETISKEIMGSTFCDASSSTAELTLSHQQIKGFLTKFLAERRARSLTGGPKPTGLLIPFAMQDLVQRPSQMKIKQSGTPKPAVDIQRDNGVPDELWAQLRDSKTCETQAEEQRKDAIAATIELAHLKAAEESGSEEEMDPFPSVKGDNAAMQESKLCQEESRLKHLAMQRAKVDAVARLTQIREEEKEKRREEYAVQKKLREMGVCVEGYRWVRMEGGWRCAGGTHWISDKQFQAHTGNAILGG